MKFLTIGIIAILSHASLAATSPMDCLKIKNNLDRKYCLDKNLETVKSAHAAEKKSWSKGLPANDRATKMSSVQESIAAKKEYVSHLQNEISLEEKHLESLKATPVAKEATKKKKKKKKGFRIKL